MKVPLSWLRDLVKITLTPEELAYRLTFAGLEVEEVEYIGLPPTHGNIDGLPKQGNGPQVNGLAWNPEKIVVAQILEVGAHPNADKLTLLRLDDGTGQEQTVLTGAPNLFQYKGQGPLAKPLKVAYAREGSVLYDGHKPGRELMTLKKAKIRGVESYSMVCSEKELGISDEHEGIIFLDDDAPVGMPLAGYMGDVVFTVKINPNMARNANLLGLAREIAALTGVPLTPPPDTFEASGPALAEQLAIEIRNTALNPRFTAALIQGVTIAPSSYRVQRRLRLAGMRPINNIVDATNYVMLEVGQPLHAFDWDILVKRSQKRVKLITRLPNAGETIKTLDGVERKLDDYTILVCDEQSALSIGGVMGGAESEVSDKTVNVLLEGAAWEFINIRRTAKSQNLPSEASYRFSRGVHPAMTVRGVSRGIELMRQWAGGTVARGLVDEYPQPAPVVTLELTSAEVERLLGISVPMPDIIRILESLEFKVTSQSPHSVSLAVPDHRLDINTGVIGQADVIEEIARVYGYDNIPEAQMADTIPPQRPNLALELEERARDGLARVGLQEIVTYSLTTPEQEQRFAPDARAYITLHNPIVAERVAMRHTLLSNVLDVLAANLRYQERVAVFEIGPVYLPVAGEVLPEEPRHLALALTGPRAPQTWQGADQAALDFFDLKGAVEALTAHLHLEGVTYEAGVHPALTPGRVAELKISGESMGWLGELHPLTRDKFDLLAQAVLVAEFDLEKLLAQVNERHTVVPVPEFPPVKEDLALIVDEATPAAQVQAVLEQAGGALLTSVTLFDVFRGEQIGVGKKSLAYRLTYQAADKTLTANDAAKLRGRIVKKAQEAVGAVLRG